LPGFIFTILPALWEGDRHVSEKLRPVFQQLLKGTSLTEYSQIVTSICEEGSDDKEDNNVDPAKDTVSIITSMQEPL
jgi:hypothetical protein